MTAAHDRLAALARWGDVSSANYPSPNSKARRPSRNFFGQPIPQTVEMVIVGRYFELIPWDFATPPTSDFDAQALPFFVSFEQAEALNLPPVADLSPPTGQGRAADRLAHVVAKLEDAKLDLARRDMAWRSPDGWQDRLCAIVPLTDPLEPIADAVARAGADTVDQDAYAVLAVPLWAMTAKERAAISHRLPLLP